MNIFSNLKVSKSFTSIELNNVLEAIQTGLIKTSTKTLSTGAEQASKEDKYSTEIFSNNKNKYNHLKSNSVMTWTPNATFLDDHRHNTKIDTLSGYVYCDVDGVDPIAVKSKVSKLPFVHAAWSSLSGTGIGFLIKADWTINNFKANYTALSKLFNLIYKLELDKTSDITRTNVFSFDPSIYINPNATSLPESVLLPFQAKIDGVKPVKASYSYDTTPTNLQELASNLDIVIDYKTKVRIAISHATRTMGAYTTGNKHNFRTSFIGTCATIGVPFDIMMEEFEAYAEGVYEEVNYEAMETMYVAFEGQGSGDNLNLTDHTPNNLRITQTLTVDKYLDSQLPTEFTKNTLLIAPTGVGKSTYVMNTLKGKRIIVCPNTAILKNFKSFKGVSVYYGEEKSVRFTDIILTTQDSLSKLVDLLKQKGGSILDYLVVIDEFHTLISSADYSYKYRAISSVMEVLQQYPVVVLGLTATPIRTVTNDFYTSFDVIQVNQRTDTPREIVLTEYDDYRSFIIEKCVKNYKNKTVTVVYKNDKRNVEVLAEALKDKGMRVVTINADEKDTVEYNVVVSQGILNCDVVLTTCLLKEGVSIKSDNPVAVDYVVTGDVHYSEINQLSSRVRNASAITVTLASSTCSYKNYSLPFFYSNVVADIDQANNFLIERFNAEAHTEVELKLDQKVLSSSIKLNTASGVYEVDSIYKDYLIYQAEKKVCTINPLYTISMLLEDSRFTVATDLVTYSEDNKNLIITAKEKVADRLINKKINFKDIVEANKNVDVLSKLNDIYETGTEQEKTLAFYTKYVYGRMMKHNLDAAIDKAYDFADNTRKFKDFKTQLELTSLFNEKHSDKSISSVFFKEIKKSLKLNKEYTSDQLLDIFKTAATKTEAKDFLNITKTKSTQWFKLLGTTNDRTTKTKDRKSVRLFTISQFGLSNFKYTPCYETPVSNTPLVRLANPYIGV